MRMRPSNFPTVRMAQFTALLEQSEALFSKVLEVSSIEEYVTLFSVEAHSWWDTHYRFDKTSSKRRKKLGKASVENLLVNTVAPFLFIYGKERQLAQYRDSALDLLEKLPGEKNSIVKKWEEIGLASHNAFQSQALLQLNQAYCTSKKCLNCNIGNQILKSRAQ